MPLSAPPSSSVRAGILITGTEVITARISDRNGPWISARLGELGVEVAHILTVADRADDLLAGLEFLAGERCELIVTSGGLGPTADDLTAEVVAGFAGRPLVLDSAMEEKIARIIAGYGRRLRYDVEAMRAGTRKQAMIPRGATAIDPAGTAPGLIVTSDAGSTVIVLPGPPRELHEMWPRAVASDEVREVLARTEPYVTRTLRLFGIPESEIAKSLREIGAEVDLAPLEITTCLRRGELEVDVRHRPGAEDSGERLAAAIAERHRRHLFSADGSTIDEQVAALLRGRSVAVAESSTGGLLAARLTAVVGASEYVAGGLIAYSNAAKEALLGVDPALIEAHGAVSPPVAEAMATGALERFDVDVACAITGIAGPGGGSEAKPVGYTCVHVIGEDGRAIARDPVIPGDRDEVRERTVTVVMHLLRRLLRGDAAAS